MRTGAAAAATGAAGIVAAGILSGAAAGVALYASGVIASGPAEAGTEKALRTSADMQIRRMLNSVLSIAARDFLRARLVQAETSTVW